LKDVLDKEIVMMAVSQIDELAVFSKVVINCTPAEYNKF